MLNNSEALGQTLRLLRRRRVFKQYQVAERAGITKAMLSAYETGKSTPSLKTLASILHAVETDFGGLQRALDVLSGAPEEQLEPREGLGSQRWGEAEIEVLEFLVAKLGAIEGVVKRIADVIESVAWPQTGVTITSGE